MLSRNKIGNTKKRNETDERRDTQFATCKPQYQHATDKGKRQIDKNNSRLHEAAELIVEKHKYHHNGKQRSDEDGSLLN